LGVEEENEEEEDDDDDEDDDVLFLSSFLCYIPHKERITRR